MYVTLIWSAVLIVSTFCAAYGFILNTTTPTGIGPLPAVFFGAAIVSLIVVLARIAG